jgi:hypothetical protein
MNYAFSIPLPLPVHLPSLSAKSIADDITDALYKMWVGTEVNIVRALMSGVLRAAAATTDIGGEGAWFGSTSTLMFPIEEFVVGPLLFLATIGAVIRQDAKRLGRIWCVGLPLSLVGGYAVSQLSFIGLKATDALSSMVQASVAPNLKGDFLNAMSLLVSGVSKSGPIGGLLALVVMAGGLTLWLELVVRSAAIELSIFFMPLAFAGLVWPATAHWAKRLLEVLAALLLAKPVVVGALSLGANALTTAGAGPSAVVTGAAILLMAAFAPLSLLKLVPMVEVSAIAHLQGVAQQPFRAAERAVQRAVSTASSVATAAAAPADIGVAAALMGQMGPGVGGEDPAGPLGPARPPGPAPDIAAVPEPVNSHV